MIFPFRWLGLFLLVSMVGGCASEKATPTAAQAAIVRLVLNEFSAKKLSDPDAVYAHRLCVVGEIGAGEDEKGKAARPSMSLLPDWIGPAQKIVPRPSEYPIGVLPTGCDSILELSGLEVRGQSAVIGADWSCGAMCGVGQTFILESRNGAWKIARADQRWMS